MSDTKNPVYLDADLLARVDGLAHKAGVDRDECVETALRRYLAGRDLVALQREVSRRGDVPSKDALELVHAERDAARAGREGGLAAPVTRAVVDVNVFVSALISPDGVAARLVQHTANGDFEVVMSPRLLRELARMTARPKLLQYLSVKKRSA